MAKDEWPAMINRRDFLKLGAASAVMTLSGCGNDPVSQLSQPTGPERPIVRATISPSIGVARVGNSVDQFYLAPELPGELPVGPFKDGAGAIKRQATRFRIYGLDSDGVAVRELSAAEANITWTVHVANQKAAWFQFETALDIPEALPTGRRNASISDRSQLIIDPGPRSLSGAGVSGIHLNTGQMQGVPIHLGELRSDEAGRLIVLGGFGRSFSPLGLPLTTFANNEGWCDDTCDGPVTATVTLNGQALPVDPAWVVVGPPNYGPAMAADFRTMYDVITQTMIEAGFLKEPTTVSFLADIYPLFERLSQLQWVNQGILLRYGWKSPDDFSDPARLNQLADPSKINEPFRQAWLARFRNPDYQQAEPDAIPPIYGDAVAVPANSNRNWLAVTPHQYRALEKWAEGAFINDLAGLAQVPQSLQDLPVRAQPAALDRAALESCLGAAFHPGCELTWPMRIASMYSGLFRLHHRQAPEPDFGSTLTPAAAVAAGGPLSGSGPGDLTRWMAVPWQADTVSCRSGYEPAVDPYLPTFWAPRVPNQVLTEADYTTVMNGSLPLEQRQLAFHQRAAFFRHIDGADRPSTLTNMVAGWYRLGLVEQRPGPPGNDFPSQLKVETENGF